MKLFFCDKGDVMSSKYSVIRQDNNSYDMCQIKIENGMKCLYWNKKGDNDIKNIVVIFSNDNVSNIIDNQMYLSFSGVSDSTDINNLMIAFGTELYKNKIDITKVDFKFIVDNKDELDIVNSFIGNFKITGDIVKSEKYSLLTENLDDAINNIATNSNDNQIVKEDNGEISKYTVHDDKIYSDNATMSITDKKRMLLSEWRHDPKKLVEIYNLSREELDKMLTDAVTNNLKVNYLEDSVDSNGLSDSFSRVSNDKAREVGGKVNSDLGIVKNSPGTENNYSAVERNGDSLNVVNPQVSVENVVVNNTKSNVSRYTSDRVSINDNGIDSSFWGDDNGIDNSLSYDSVRDAVNDRNGNLPVYYVGSEDEIYNQYGKIVGRNGVGGYQINVDNNLLRYGNVIGQIGDINDMNKNAFRENSKVRVFKPKNKPYNRDNGKSAAFVSLPVVMFIVSLFLLVVSGIILFIMK